MRRIHSQIRRFMDIQTAADILTENHMCLAEAKSHGLTHICKATQT